MSLPEIIFKIFGYLLSSLVALVEHVVEHDWLFHITGMHGQGLDQVLLSEPLLTHSGPGGWFLNVRDLTHLLADVSS